MVNLAEADLLDLFFPGIGGHVEEPESPYPYSQRFYFDRSSDIESVHMNMIQVCMWARDNFKDKTWCINKTEFHWPDDGSDVCFCFDFIHAEDAMAFKLRWL